MTKINTSGFKELERKLKKIGSSAKSLEGKNSIPLTDLFHCEFMQIHTKFSSI